MYLEEVEEGQTRDDLALIIEEVLRQRILGVKNEFGVYIAPAFPKLILCLSGAVLNKDSKYHYLLKLASDCTARRLVPEKIGHIKPCEQRKLVCAI